MTTPTTDPAAATGNTDTPYATVPFGPSEIVSYLTALAALLNGYLGKDYGLSKNAQAISLLIAGLVVFGSTVSRAIKHHTAMQTNAQVYAAQLAHVANVVAADAGGNKVKALTDGVAALNGAVATVTGQTEAKSPS